MAHLTFMDPEWDDRLRDLVRSTSPDAEGNSDNVTLVMASWIALLADCPGQHKPHKVLHKFYKRLLRDFSGTVADASDLSALLLESVTRVDGIAVPKSLHKEFGRWPIFREYKRWFDGGSDDIWTYLLTFLNWGKKAEFIDPKLQPESLTRWLAIESELCRVDPESHYLDDLRFILGHLPNPDIENINFRFGQKRVSEPDIKVYSAKLPLRYHSCVDEILDQVSYDSPGLQYVIPDPELWEAGRNDKQYASIDYAWWMTVVKDRRSVRSISKEPNTLMYAQQCILSMLLTAIRKSPFSRVIDIADQSKNALLALYASQSGDYDTIDLKDASDRASNRVVKRIFPPLWNNLFQASRSSRVRLPSGRIKRVEKFAPMGSALCFPVQTLIFTAVTCLARFLVSEGCDVETYLAGRGPTIHRLKVDYTSCVYGDDIICKSSDTKHVISLLEALGFRVNIRKSFLEPSAFRESCGMYALDGTDVTPILFKVKGLATNDLQWVEGLISLCNRLFMAGFVSTHAFLAGYLPRHFYVEVPFEGRLPVNPYELLSDEPDNSKLKSRRWNKDLQREEVRIKSYRVPILEVGVTNRRRFLPGENQWNDDSEVDMQVLIERARTSARHDRYQYACFMQAPRTTEGAKPPVGDVAQPTVRALWVRAE